MLSNDLVSFVDMPGSFKPSISWESACCQVEGYDGRIDGQVLTCSVNLVFGLTGSV